MKHWVLIFCLFASPAWAIELEGSTDSLEVVTTTTAAIDYTVKWANRTATALTTPGTSVGQITSATTTTIVAAPSAANWRLVGLLTLRNSGSASNVVTVQVDRSAANRTMHSATLGPGESLNYDGTRFSVFAASGVERSLKFENVGFTGKSYTFGKVATVFDTVGYHYAYFKDVGFPGVWTPGTPGLNGVATNCDAAVMISVAPMCASRRSRC